MRDSLDATQFRETLLVSFFLAVLLSLDTRAKGDDEDEALYSIPPRTLERRRLSSLLSLSLFLSRVVLFFSLLKRRSDTRPGRPRLFPRTLDRSDFRFVFSSRDCSPGTGVSRRLR